MIIHNKNHNIAVKKVKSIFNNAGLFCDYEDKEGYNSEKTPDLICEKEKIVIEVKTFQGDNNDRNKEKEVLKFKKISKDFLISRAHWIEEKHNTFSHRIERASKQFKNYPNYRSLVVFINFMMVDDQHIVDLLYKEGWIVNSGGSAMEFFQNLKDRIVTENKNNQIGAIAQVYDDELLIIHNGHARKERMIPSEIGSKLNATQKIYKDNKITDYKI